MFNININAQLNDSNLESALTLRTQTFEEINTNIEINKKTNIEDLPQNNQLELVENQIKDEVEEKEEIGKFALFKNEFFLGIIICFAQIPESVAFGYLANIEPSVALHGAWIVGVIASLFGGRPGLVSGFSGAYAAIIQKSVKYPEGSAKSGEGIEIVFIATFVAGAFMIIARIFKLSRFISMIPSTVMIGFCNGLAIVTGLAQLHPFQNKDHSFKSGAELGWMIFITFGSMIIMEGLPKIPHKIAKVIPSSLISIIFSMIIEFGIIRNVGHKTNTIGDVSPFSSETAFPYPFFLDKRYDLSKISNDPSAASKILWLGFMLGLVGIIESLMTMEIVNEITKTEGNRNKHLITLGAANIIAPFMGGAGGDAMIGLTTINCINGGKTRIAPSVTAFGMMIMVMGGYPLLNYIPVAALAGMMIIVVYHTFKWYSLKMIFSAFLPKKLRDKFGFFNKINREDVFVIILVTVVTVVLNLVYAVILGVVFSACFYVWNSGNQMDVVPRILNLQNEKKEKLKVKIYEIKGSLFFASKMKFMKLFSPKKDPDNVQIHFPENTLFDYSAIEALNSVSKEYKENNKVIHVKRLHEENEKLIQKSNNLVKHIKFIDEGDIVVPKVPENYTYGLNAEKEEMPAIHPLFTTKMTYIDQVLNRRKTSFPDPEKKSMTEFECVPNRDIKTEVENDLLKENSPTTTRKLSEKKN